MDNNSAALNALLNKIPRRFSIENIAGINQILNDYENVLIGIEAINPYYEKGIPGYFEEMEAIRSAVKKSGENKNTKKVKDQLFDAASGELKDTMQSVIDFYSNGEKA